MNATADNAAPLEELGLSGEELAYAEANLSAEGIALEMHDHELTAGEVVRVSQSLDRSIGIVRECQDLVRQILEALDRRAARDAAPNA